MQNSILDKIRQTPPDERCRLAAEIFPQLEAELVEIGRRSDEEGLAQDFIVANQQIDLLEAATDELTIKLTGLQCKFWNIRISLFSFNFGFCWRLVR